jgi:hypothetical protein
LRIAVASAWRNSAGNVRLYMQRINALREEMGVPIRVVAGEGDSRDETQAVLRREAANLGIRLELVDCTHGQRVFGSTEEPERMRALSLVCNRIFGAAKAEDDVFLYVESDLHWDAQTLRQLAEEALWSERFHVVAPMVMAGLAFYDIWGFRAWSEKEGKVTRFGPHRPFHPSLGRDNPSELYSAGSCLAMQGSVAVQVRVRDDNAFVGWCGDARSQGFRIGVRSDLTVRQQ